MKRIATNARRPMLLAASLCAALLLMAPAASLAGGSVDGYGGDGGQVQSSIASGGGGGDGPSSSDSSGSDGSVSGSGSGSLPFTGLDVGWMIGGAALLIGAGVVMGRSASRGDARA